MKIKVVQEYFNLSYGKLSQKIFSHVSFFYAIFHRFYLI